jgi:hypothetical protein
VLLTVTGRAVAGSSTAYHTVQVTFTNNGVFSDAYYSNYEVIDPNQNQSVVTVVTGTATTYDTVLSAPPLQTGKTFWQSLCQYDTYAPNTFIDGLGTLADPYAGGTFSATDPYYGPYRGSEPDSTSNNNVFSYTYPGASPTTTASVTDPCEPPANFVYGETFTGRVYSNDQLWACAIGSGSLDFAGGVQSGVSEGFAYNGKWPTQDGTSSGTNGWIDNGQIDKTNGLGTPAKNGWDGSCGAGAAAAPSFGTSGLTQGGTQSLPPIDNYLQNVATEEGCNYSGPTMIEFAGGGTFNVWSPESGDLSNACGGDFATSTSGWGSGTVPTTGLVMYVGTGSAAPAVSTYTGTDLPTGATCLNPWTPYLSASLCPSLAGDAIVGGEAQGEVTIGAANNIVISRNLVYQCIGSVTSQQSDTFTAPSTCSTESDPDVLGLIANQDVVISKPGVQLSSLPPTGTEDDQVPRQTVPGEWPALESTAGDINSSFCNWNGLTPEPGQTAAAMAADIVPDCDLENPVIDAAVVALNGALSDEDWDLGPDISAPAGTAGSQENPSLTEAGAGDVYLYGTDAGDYRGPMGCADNPPPNASSVGCPATAAGEGEAGAQTGYDLVLSYDQRLHYLSPPSMIEPADAAWTPGTFVNCGSNSTMGVTGNTGVSKGPSANICPGLNPLDGAP